MDYLPVLFTLQVRDANHLHSDSLIDLIIKSTCDNISPFYSPRGAEMEKSTAAGSHETAFMQMA